VELRRGRIRQKAGVGGQGVSKKKKNGKREGKENQPKNRSGKEQPNLGCATTENQVKGKKQRGSIH